MMNPYIYWTLRTSMRKNVIEEMASLPSLFCFFGHFFSIAMNLVPATASYDHTHEDCTKISVDAYV